LFLQGVTSTRLTETQKNRSSQKATPQVLYFAILPMPFIEFGNVQGIITYKKKIKGIEKGKKRERAYITDKNNIRNIISKKRTKLK
jgi:hypothetical protein